MKYLSLDIETTSLIPDPKNILMISMIVEDSKKPIPVEELPHFTAFIKHNEIHGQPYALAMNGWILDIIAGRNKNPPYQVLPGQGEDTMVHWTTYALKFLESHFGTTKITVAGKNVAGFDIPFLPQKIRDRFRHRCIDAGSVLINWHGDAPLDLAQCKAMVGINTPVAHDAREDAMDVIRVLRATYPKGVENV